MSQWGHDFRPEYLQLSVLHERFPSVPRIALTATADEPTRREIRSGWTCTTARVFIAGFDRPNIRYRVVPKQNPREQLVRLLDTEHRGDAGIVYCLHAGGSKRPRTGCVNAASTPAPTMPASAPGGRADAQDAFVRREGVVIVATIAFGMGIDKPNVRFVAHLDLPKSLEAYYQETGRSGRDGLPATAWMAYGLQDVITLRQMVDGSEADEARKRLEIRKLDAMLGYCELATCRRRTLLAYFGETLKEPCGNCDNCLEPPESWDATEAAQQALSCVYRTGQRFGVAYVVDVLRGKDDDRIRRFRHDRLSTFGIGADLDARQWRSVLRQLVARGLLSVDVERYGSLQLTAAARPVLRGEATVELRRDALPARKVRPAREARDRVRSVLGTESRALFDALRAHRRELAEEQGVPPYVIFHDASLVEMAERRPRSLDEFAAIPGVGATKLERYGETFIEIILAHEADEHAPAATAVP